MKDVNPEIDISNLPKDPEKITDFSIDAPQYDETLPYLTSVDDMTEKVVKYMEKEIRSSYEYNNYIHYLKEELDLTKCPLLPGLDCSNGAASLEFHHYPLNLYEITEIVGKQMLSSLGSDDSLSCFDISEQVMKEHYLGNIGLIPMTKTLHEMAHNNTIVVPISKVNGNYKKFVEKYSSSIDNDIKDRIKDAELNSESDDSKLYNSLKLEKNIAKYDVRYINSDEDSDDLEEDKNEE